MHHLLDNGSDGLVLAGTTGEGSTLDDEEKLRLWQLALDELRADAIIANTGSNDTAHSVHLTEKATELGVDATLVVTPYYNKPNRARDHRALRRAARARPTGRSSSTTSRRAAWSTSRTTCSRELAQIDNVSAVKQARIEDIEPIDGMDLLAGNDDVLAQRDGPGRHRRHPGGVAPVRQRDEADRRGAGRARRGRRQPCATRYAAIGVTVNPIPVKTALHMLGLDPGNFRLPMVPASQEEAAEVRSMLERHGLLSAV